MAIADEITRIIRERIQNFGGATTETAMVSVGTVISVADGIARVSPSPSWATMPRSTKTTRCVPRDRSSRSPWAMR